MKTILVATFVVVGLVSELWAKLGDGGVSEAAYRGG